MMVFVSGGSRGIGRGIVKQFLMARWNVVFTYAQNEIEAQKVLDWAKENAPQQSCQAVRCDIRNSAEVEEVAERVLEQHDQVDALICNAGIAINGIAASLSNENWEAVLHTNLSGSFYLCRAFLSHFLSNRFGRIVLMSSVTRHGAAGQLAYSTTKAGLVGMGQSLAKEYGAKGITCNVIAPGYIETEMVLENISEKNTHFWNTYCPLRKAGSVSDVAHAALYLCSKEAAFVNGTVLRVDGGLDWQP